MSRYIDADTLKYYGNHIGDEYEERFHDAQWVYRSQIDEAPTIDIVRCSECKWHDTCCRNIYEDWRDATPTDIEYCSYGEREGE